MLCPNGRGRPTILSMDKKTEDTCPVCQSGDLVTISMSVSASDLSFTTCHLCEAKWWHQDGKAVPLQSVIGLVVSPGA